MSLTGIQRFQAPGCPITTFGHGGQETNTRTHYFETVNNFPEPDLNLPLGNIVWTATITDGDADVDLYTAMTQLVCGLGAALPAGAGKIPQRIVKIVEKNFSLQMRKLARQAATAALAAHKHGRFWEFDKKLYESTAGSNDAQAQEIAMQLGQDMEKFNAALRGAPERRNKDLKEPATQPGITRDLQEGTAAGVRGTPSIFVNGKPLANMTIG